SEIHVRLRSVGVDGAVRGIHRVEGDDRVRIGAAGTHLGGDPDRLHDLLLGRALAHRLLGVPIDAVRALGDMRHGDGDQLLRLLVEGTGREHLGAELRERRSRVVDQVPSPAQQAGGAPRVRRSGYVYPSWIPIPSASVSVTLAQSRACDGRAAASGSPPPHPPSRMRRPSISPSSTAVAKGAREGTTGRIDVSTTRSPVTPWTRAAPSTTGPTGAVPLMWMALPRCDRAQASSASSSSSARSSSAVSPPNRSSKAAVCSRLTALRMPVRIRARSSASAR